MFDIDDEVLEAARRERNGETESLKEFLYACTLEELPTECERARMVTVDDGEIALFRIEGQVYATSNICPHEMSPLLAAGTVDCANRTVTCPLHGWVFDIPSGRQLAPVEGSGSIPVYEVRIEDAEVWVREV
ncbi:MAG TPA: nitrite reductase (NAD(P)H) small subunit [Candidatus Kapabacteria bacterium]